MCSAVALAGVTAGVNIATQGVAAKAQDIAAEKAWGSAQGDLMTKYNAIQLRENQEMQKTQLETFQVTQTGVGTASRIRAQLAAGGVAGASATERAAAPGIAATNFGATARVNLANELRQNQADAASFKAKAQETINENQPKSGASLALGVAGSVLSAAGQSGIIPQPGGSQTPQPGQTEASGEAEAGADLAAGVI